MGWGSGSELAENLWTELRPLLKPSNLEKAAKLVISNFEDMDCDTLDECEQLIKDANLPRGEE